MAGAATTVSGMERIRVGYDAIIRDSELFATIFHEEMHLRVMQKALRDQAKGKIKATSKWIDLHTGPRILEEDYIEAVARRYLRKYEDKLEAFAH